MRTSRSVREGGSRTVGSGSMSTMARTTPALRWSRDDDERRRPDPTATLLFVVEDRKHGPRPRHIGRPADRPTLPFLFLGFQASRRTNEDDNDNGAGSSTVSQQRERNLDTPYRPHLSLLNSLFAKLSLSVRRSKRRRRRQQPATALSNIQRRRPRRVEQAGSTCRDGDNTTTINRTRQAGLHLLAVRADN
jgi:hypothetical protein